MGKKTCALCGYESEPGTIGTHLVIPTEISQQSDILESRITRLCRNCRQELAEWYSSKVTNIVYDTKAKRFRAKSSPEMAREYESAYDSFVKYKQKE